jgi:hypothetical protein
MPDPLHGLGELEVSGDISPPGDSRLDAPARPGSGRAHRVAARRPAHADPSMVRVVATTVRLWWRRRILRVADGARLGALRWSAVAVVIAVVAACGVAFGLAGSQPAAPVRHVPPHRGPTAAQLLTQANEQSASSWLDGQLAAGAQVGCDPAMCGYLQHSGIPAAQEVVLKPSAAVPGAAAFVISTPALRGRAGAALAAGAPETIASFGTGRERVDVLVASSGGAAAFLAAAQQAVAASARTGRSLLRNRQLHVGPGTRQELVSGQVDQRLLGLLKQLLAAHPVFVAGFADGDPGASWPAQLRSVLMDGLIRHAGKHRISDLKADLSLLRGERPQAFSWQQVKRSNGSAALVIQVPVQGSS